MNIRELAGNNSNLAVAVSALVILAAAGSILYQLKSKPEVSTYAVKSIRVWYSDDDGRTCFADSIDKIAPFDHQGKKAYRAYTCTCDGGKSKFVVYLERFTDQGKYSREHHLQNDTGNSSGIEYLQKGMLEVKRPLTGDMGWVELNSPAGKNVRIPRCPVGMSGNLQMIPTAQ